MRHCRSIPTISRLASSASRLRIRNRRPQLFKRLPLNRLRLRQRRFNTSGNRRISGQRSHRRSKSARDAGVSRACTAAARTAILLGRLAEARAALEELVELEPSLPVIPELEAESRHRSRPE